MSEDKYKYQADPLVDQPLLEILAEKEEVNDRISELRGSLITPLPEETEEEVRKADAPSRAGMRLNMSSNKQYSRKDSKLGKGAQKIDPNRPVNN